MFWFVVALIFFILWITKKASASERNRLFKSGYDAGYEALRQKLASILDKNKNNDSELANLAGTATSSGISPHAPLPHAPINEPRSVLADTAHSDNDADDMIDDTPLTSRQALQPATITVAQSRILSAEKIVEDPHTRSVRNLNVILYLASFLLVAAAAALIAASMPAAIRLSGLIAVVILFYVTGIILYKRTQILRPAAIAFIGTGLAIIPFVGVALTSLIGVAASTSWLIVSIVGTAAYFSAAILLQSQLVSYLSMAFVLSLTSSFVAIAPVGFVWYFVVLIATSLGLSMLAYYKPAWVPDVFTKPVETTGQLVTPLALIVSLISINTMTLDMYEIVFGAATLYYLVLWMQRRSATYEAVSRFGFHVTLLLITADVFGIVSHVGAAVWLGLAILQAAYSLLRIKNDDSRNKLNQSVFIALALVLCVVGTAFWSAPYVHASLAILNWIAVSTIGTIAVLRFKNTSWAYPSLLGSLFILPELFNNVLNLSQPLPWLALSYAALASIVCVLLAFVHDQLDVKARTVSYVSFGIWLSVAATYSIVSADSAIIAIVFIIGAITTAALSHQTRRPAIEIIAAACMYVGILAALDVAKAPDAWRALFAGTLSAAIMYGCSFVYHGFSTARRNYLFALGNIFVATTVYTAASGNVPATRLAFLLLFVATVVSLLLRLRARGTFIRQTLIVSYVTYSLLLWIASWPLGAPWTISVYVLGAGLYWYASHLEKVSWLHVVGNVAFIAAVGTAIAQTDIAGNWKFFDSLWVATLGYAGFYAYYIAKKDSVRATLAIVSVWITLFTISFSGFGGTVAYMYASAVTFVIASASVMLHGYLSRRRTVMEIGFYVLNGALQRLVGLTFPDLNLAFYTHWWAATVLLAAWQLRSRVHERVLVALALITLVTGGYALGEGGSYSLLFLIEQIIVAVAGALSQKQWILWWGLAASVLAIMYFLRDYVYLWLGFLGLSLIGVVVWRLRRIANQ